MEYIGQSFIVEGNMAELDGAMRGFKGREILAAFFFHPDELIKAAEASHALLIRFNKKDELHGRLDKHAHIKEISHKVGNGHSTTADFKNAHEEDGKLDEVRQEADAGTKISTKKKGLFPGP